MVTAYANTGFIQPVILCGGDGTRLWPASRKALPKQFMDLGGTTLFKETVFRVSQLPEVAEPLVLCNNNHRFLAASQLQEIVPSLVANSATEGNVSSGSTIILEPVGRNTAPAIALAALHLLPDDPVMLVMPSDHRIEDVAMLTEGVHKGAQAASDGLLVTFGVVPTGPETGYGYIQQAEEQAEGVYRVARFVEKPSMPVAEAFVREGGYLWNSGLFMFKPSVFLQELQAFRPDIYEACLQAHTNRVRDLDFIRADEAAFSACPSDSVDYAVMERTSRAVVIPLPLAWSDLGSWNSLYELGGKDSHNNSVIGDVLLEDCHGSYVFSQSRLVAGIGLEEMVVVETADAVMVAPLARSQEVKKLVAALQQARRPEAEQHARVYRPWGSYEILILDDRFQVKRIVVAPGQRLSLQKHYHRAEHWVVVRGTALVTLDATERILVENESTYIPPGGVHRLENPGKVALELIEIQTGSYLGEDDIVRLEDCYGRE